MNATIEATEKPQPATQPSVPEFPAGFIGSLQVVPDARDGWESLVARIGPGGPRELVQRYRLSIDEAAERMKAEHADAIREARDLVPAAEADRLRALLKTYEGQLPALDRAKSLADAAARAAAVAGVNVEEAEQRLRLARDACENGARRAEATKTALSVATRRLAEAREEAAQRVKKQLRSELDAAARDMAADLANIAAPKLAALSAIRAALSALKQ